MECVVRLLARLHANIHSKNLALWYNSDKKCAGVVEPHGMFWRSVMIENLKVWWLEFKLACRQVAWSRFYKLCLTMKHCKDTFKFYLYSRIHTYISFLLHFCKFLYVLFWPLYLVWPLSPPMLVFLSVIYFKILYFRRQCVQYVAERI